MRPDWGLNPQPCGVQDDAATNRATWPGHFLVFFRGKKNVEVELLNEKKCVFKTLTGTVKLNAKNKKLWP